MRVLSVREAVVSTKATTITTEGIVVAEGIVTGESDCSATSALLGKSTTTSYWESFSDTTCVRNLLLFTIVCNMATLFTVVAFFSK